MLPAEVGRLLLEDELAAATAWCSRRGIGSAHTEDDLALKLVLAQPTTGLSFYLRGDFDSYKAIPPQWEFFNESWSLGGKPQFYPKPVPTPHGSSLFHSTPCICAPFNRLAFEENGGPHADWGGLSNWSRVDQGQIVGLTVGDMVAAIVRDFQHTRGRMADQR